MGEADDRVKIIQAYFDGIKGLIASLKDLALAVAAVATVWYQSSASGKLDAVGAKADIAAAKTQIVEQKLDHSTEKRDQKLEAIAETSKEGRDVITAWKESYERPAAKADPNLQ